MFRSLIVYYCWYISYVIWFVNIKTKRSKSERATVITKTVDSSLRTINKMVNCATVWEIMNNRWWLRLFHYQDRPKTTFSDYSVYTLYSLFGLFRSLHYFEYNTVLLNCRILPFTFFIMSIKILSNYNKIFLFSDTASTMDLLGQGKK